MSRLIGIALVPFVALAAPASAGTFGVEFPTLTWPETAPAPDATQGCLDPTALTVATCDDAAE